MCSSCEAVVINGLLCHEHGCPDTPPRWEVESSCGYCGDNFKPEYKGQKYCCSWCEENHG